MRRLSPSTCRTRTPIREGMEIARYAEAKGFHAVWQAESRLVREATVPMAAFLAVTERIKVGSGVVNNWTRNPALLASTFSTLDDLAPGRVDPRDRCLVGAARRQGRRAPGQAAARRCGRRSRRSGPCSPTSASPTRASSSISTASSSTTSTRSGGPKDVPIYIGATGMQMMELAGEIADGVVLNYLVSPVYNDMAMEHLERGARRAGRSATDLDRPQLVVCSLDEDRDAALDAARLLVTQYLGQQPHIMKASGVPESLLEEIGKVLTWPATAEEVEAASRLVPDEIVQMITASGTADGVPGARWPSTCSGGCTCPVLYPLGPDVHAMIDAFADWTGASPPPGPARRRALDSRAAAQSRSACSCARARTSTGSTRVGRPFASTTSPPTTTSTGCTPGVKARCHGSIGS